jgi:hypothetical protein
VKRPDSASEPSVGDSDYVVREKEHREVCGGSGGENTVMSSFNQQAVTIELALLEK